MLIVIVRTSRLRNKEQRRRQIMPLIVEGKRHAHNPLRTAGARLLDDGEGSGASSKKTVAGTSAGASNLSL